MFGGGGDSGPNFDLPDEILSVIPTDPFEQLDLARKITSMAIASRVSNLQAETVGLRQKLLDKESVMDELKDKMSCLERDCREANTRLKTILDENMKLSKERDSLAMTVKKLSRDVAKLETFKKQLFQSLNDDNGSQVEPVDVRTCDQSVPGSYPEKDQRSNGQRSFNRSIEMSNPVDEASRYAGQKFSITPYISPRLTPSGTPKIISASVSPRGYSAAGSPKKTSGAVSPIGSHYDGKTTAFWSSQQSSTGNSPPRGRSLPARTPRMDGKEFFRQARSRLSYEQFSAFLANIKELNAQKQTREETLRKAEEIFGMENKDLYLSFQGLINRSVR